MREVADSTKERLLRSGWPPAQKAVVSAPPQLLPL